MRELRVGVAALGALAFAACGGSRSASIPPDAARRLAAESEAVAARVRAGDSCGAIALARRLARDAAAYPAVHAAARGLAAEIACVPPAPRAAPAPTSVTAPRRHEHARRHRHEHGHDKHRKGGKK